MIENKIKELTKKIEKIGEKETKEIEKCIWKFYATNYWSKESPITQRCLNCDAYDKNCLYYKTINS
ncbi:MAG: hypothetical protein ACPLXC_03105 [Candidatus Pacearchaeota archaeon]